MWTILIGSEIRRSKNGYELYDPNDRVWIPVYDVMKITSGVESPMESDLSPPNLG